MMLTYAGCRLLALLIIVDGAWVASRRLAQACSVADICSLVHVLRYHYGCSIEGKKRSGYRLIDLPDDLLLDPILEAVHELRQHEGPEAQEVAA